MGRRTIPLHFEALASLLVEGRAFRVTQGIPASAQPVECTYSPSRNALLLVVESPGFVEVPGQDAPDLDVHVESIRLKPAASGTPN